MAGSGFGSVRAGSGWSEAGRPTSAKATPVFGAQTQPTNPANPTVSRPPRVRPGPSSTRMYGKGNSGGSFGGWG